jgi:MFS family permease
VPAVVADRQGGAGAGTDGRAGASDVADTQADAGGVSDTRAGRRGLGQRLGQTFQALRHRDFLYFWIGQVVSNTGTWAQSIAQAWLVLRLTDSPLALGTVTMLQALPVLLLGLFGGVIADRFPKRRLLLITQIGMLTQALLLGVLTLTGLIQLWQVYALALSLGVMNALDNPTRQTLVSELVPTSDLPNAVALNSLSFNTSRLIGPALGGVTIALIGVAGCFFLNAVSFLGVVSSLLLIRARPSDSGVARGRGAMFSQIHEGLRYAFATPDVLVIVVLMGAIGTFGYNFQTILPLIAEYVLNADPASFGLLTSSMAVGSVVSALLMASRGRVTRRRIVIGGLGFSLLLLGVAFATSWELLIPLLILLGAFSILFSSSANVRLQTVTPPALRGRVMSIYTLLFLGSTPVGSMIVGTLAERQGVRVAIAEMAVVCLVGVIAGLVYMGHVRGQLTPDDEPTSVPKPAPAR